MPKLLCEMYAQQWRDERNRALAAGDPKRAETAQEAIVFNLKLARKKRGRATPEAPLSPVADDVARVTVQFGAVASQPDGPDADVM